MATVGEGFDKGENVRDGFARADLFDDSRADNSAVCDARDGLCCLWCADAEADDHGQVGVRLDACDFGRDIGAAWRSVARGVARFSERWRATSPSTSTRSAAQIQPTAQRKLPCEVVVDVELRTC